MTVIFSFSAQPATESSELSGRITGFLSGLLGEDLAQHLQWLEFLVRKMAHFSEYGLLGVLAGGLLLAYGHPPRRQWIALAGCAVYAVSDELHQMFVPGRSPGVRDVCIDSAGACVGILFVTAAVLLWRRLHARQQSNS